MHDDQHGTAIISSAALLNALELQKKKIEKVSIVVNGAGAAATACMRLYVSLGAKPENFIVFDKEGILHNGRTDIPELQQPYVKDKKYSSWDLAKAMKDADVFLGLSVGNVVTPDMVKSMAKNPIVFAMANPVPEIMYDVAKACRKDLIMATGRSDTPNMVNNVLGFPYIFRGALDVRATSINEAMKLAAVKALADLAKTPVPDIVNLAYNEKTLSFGEDYIIPKPLDPRLLAAVAPAVAKAAIESGVARKTIKDWDAYEIEMNSRLGLDNQLSRAIGNKARQSPKRVVFADAENSKILKAAQLVLEEKIGFPILLGDEKTIRQIAEDNAVDLEGIPIINPKANDTEDMRKSFGEIFFEKRKRKGVNNYEAYKAMKDRNHFGCMMVETGVADCMISGLSRNYPDTIKPALQIIGTDPTVKKIAGMYLLFTKKGPLFLADTTVNFNPTAEELAEITLLVAKEVKHFNIVPRVAMLSYSNFGSSNSDEAKLVQRAHQIVKAKDPTLICDGEMQGILAFNKEILKENYPFSELINGGDVNTLIFPNLAAGNIAYNLLQEVGGADSIGPILLGLNKPVHVLQLGSSIRSIFNMVVIAVVDAQAKSKGKETTVAATQDEIKKHKWWKSRRKVES
jgi:malate dehydrogenase (oxaloacetate-decarboxylating)(NADP+)